MRLPAKLRAAFPLLAQESGVAAVEFSLILPILLVLWIGGVEVTGALAVDRRLNNLASATGDLVAQAKKLKHREVTEIFDIARGAMFPYPADGVTMRVSAVEIDEARSAKVTWSRACLMQGAQPRCTAATGTHAAYAADAPANGVVPENLRIADTQIIMSEVFYTYQPAVGHVMTGDLALADRMFFVPRLVQAIQLCDDAGNNCTPDT